MPSPFVSLRMRLSAVRLLRRPLTHRDFALLAGAAWTPPVVSSTLLGDPSRAAGSGGAIAETGS